jgi:hypothetical protein
VEKLRFSRVEARAKEKNACPWSSEFGLRLAFEFTARSNAQKGRALQPNGEKRSHGVDSFIRQPNHNFHEIPLPISLTQQDSSSRQPKLDWVVTLPLAGDFLRHLSTGHHKRWLTDSALFTAVHVSDSEPARSIYLSAEVIILLAVHVLIDPLHQYYNEQGAEEYFLQCTVFFTITIVCRSAPHMSRGSFLVEFCQ